MSSQITSGIDKQELHLHFYKTLRRYNIKSGLSKQLHYNNSWKAKVVFMDHDYCRNIESLFDHEILLRKNTESHLKSTKAVPTSNADIEETLEHNDKESQQQNEGNEMPCSDKRELMYQNEDKKSLHLIELLHASKQNSIEVKLPSYQKVQPCGLNYVSVEQGKGEWHTLRVGKITASKIPSLLGFCGHKQFNQAWFCIHNKLDENKDAPKKFKNYTRGVEFEGKAIELFEEMTGMLFVHDSEIKCKIIER